MYFRTRTFLSHFFITKIELNQEKKYKMCPVHINSKFNEYFSSNLNGLKGVSEHVLE